MKAPIFTAALATVCLSFSLNSLAQIQVVDSKPIVDNRSPSIGTGSISTPATSDAKAQQFYQLQQLQQEVMQLRGLVEQQAFELKRVKQQRMDDYLDLDRRISTLSKPGVGANNIGNTAAAAMVTKPVVGVVNSAPSATSQLSGGEMQAYRAAIDLVLNKNDYAQGEVLLQNYIRDYPNGKYLVNCQYWLGQIYLAKSDYEQAKQRFLIVSGQHPKHDKAPDARFKLGKVYHLLGDSANAKPYLQQAAAGSGNVASLAKAYLEKYFR